MRSLYVVGVLLVVVITLSVAFGLIGITVSPTLNENAEGVRLFMAFLGL